MRTVTEWRPEPLLCKRFNVPDPYKGRPAPAGDPGARFKSDRLALPDTAEAARQLALPGPPPLHPTPAPPGLAGAATAPVLEDNRSAADAFLDSLAAEASPPATASAATPAALPPPPGMGKSAPGTLFTATAAHQLRTALFCQRAEAGVAPAKVSNYAE